MAENKSDFIKDPQYIKEEMEKLKEHLRIKKGFNSDSRMFEVDKDANGNVLVLKTVVDNNRDLPSEWNYGTYLLDGYPKTGFYTMKDGKYVFLPTKNEIDKSKEVEYDTVQDFRAAIIAANPHLEHQVSMTSGFGAEGVIQIEGSLNGIQLPTTDLYYDEQKGCIVSSINPGIEFRVEFISSAERDVSNVGIGAEPVSSDVQSSLRQSAVRDVESRNESEGRGVSPMEYGVEIINFSLMKSVFESQYRFGDDNNVVTEEKDGTRDVLKESSTSAVDDPRRVEAIMRVNQAWIESYHTVLEGAGKTVSEKETAFMGDDVAGIFDHIVMGLLKGGAQLKMSELPKMLFDRFGMEYSGLVKVMLHFICHPDIAPMFELQMDMGPDEAVEQVEAERGNYLMDEAEDVMQKVMAPLQGNPNNPPRP